ncbi:MAG TPA: hypothetical protein PLA68_02425 [Panacibacter sp.]|nr:hypothetical protein [Panacibacter sp.]
MFTKAGIEKYFIAEKQESLLFIAIGIAAIIIAALGLFLWKTQAWKGAAIPLTAIALLQIIVGYTVYARSDKQRTDNVYAYDMNPSRLVKEELPRMEAVNKNFVVYRYIEIAFIITGIILMVLFKSNMDKQFWLGFGIALTIQAALMLGADHFAEQRAKIYTDQLRSLTRQDGKD